MIPPRPWRISPVQPWRPPAGQRVYILDAAGHAVISAQLDADVGELIIDAVNGEGVLAERARCAKIVEPWRPEPAAEAILSKILYPDQETTT